MDNTNETEDKQIQPADPLMLDVADQVLVKVITERIEASNKYYNDKKIKERRDKNEKYLFGRQIDDLKLKKYQSPYSDNVLYEAMETIKPIALSRLPDLTVLPGNESPEAKDIAENATKIIDSDLKTRDNRRVVSVAFKHIPVGFAGIIKPRWNPEKGKDGDYEFVNVHYNNVVFDHTAKSNNPDEMDFIAERVEWSVKECVMRFPEKSDELLKKLSIDDAGKKDEKKMASKISVWEVWFTWYEKGEDDKYERIEGVAWKYENLILKKMRNPYWDWEGAKRLFKYSDIDKRTSAIAEGDIRQALLDGMPMQDTVEEQIFHNYFESPRKPYIILGYDQFGSMPLDETSHLEQAITMQDNINKRGRQITEMVDRARTRHIFSNQVGVTKEMMEEWDMDDPTQDILLTGEIDKFHREFKGEQPSQALFEEQDLSRNRVYALMGTHSTTRGQKETDTATTSQILRDADYGRIDDYTEDTVNYAFEQMADWAMQFIKLFYTEDHMRRVVGKDGQTLFYKLNRDMIDDGMEVTVTATGVDKTMRKKEAYERAKMKLTDPLTFYEDIDAPNPKERAERLMLYMSNPEMYIMQVIKGQDMATMTGAISQQPGVPVNQDTGIDPQTQAAQDIGMLQQGVMPVPPQPVDPEYINNIVGFMQSPEFMSLPPEVQAMAQQYAQQLLDLVQGQMNQPPTAADQQPSPVPPQANGQPTPTAPVSPLQ